MLDDELPKRPKPAQLPDPIFIGDQYLPSAELIHNYIQESKVYATMTNEELNQYHSYMLQQEFFDDSKIGTEVSIDQYLDFIEELNGFIYTIEQREGMPKDMEQDWEYCLVAEKRRILFGQQALEAENIERGERGSIDWFILIGDFWRVARESAGYTKSQLSEKRIQPWKKLNLSISEINNLERGVLTFDQATNKKLFNDYAAAIGKPNLFDMYQSFFKI